MEKSKNSLLQVLGLGTAILLVAGNMIGSGVFKKIAPMSVSIPNETLILLAWFCAGIITILGAFTFASLASITDEAGGQFVYFKNAFGDFWGFLFGWGFFTVISTASIASIVYVFAESFNSFVSPPQILQQYQNITIVNYIFPFKNATIKLIAIITLIFLTILNVRSVKGGGFLSNIVTSAKLLGIITIIVVGLLYHEPTQIVTKHTTSTLPFFYLSMLLQISAFFTAMLGAFWAYDGWVNITNMASEFKNPMRNIPIAIVVGTIIVMALYILVNYAYLQILTPSDFANLTKSDGKIAAVEVARVALGGFGAVAISILIMISTFGATQGSTMSAARVYYQMSKDGYFFKPFAKVHHRYNTPYFSLYGQMIWASLLIVSGTFDQLTDMLIFAAYMFYGMGAVAVLKLKKEGKLQRAFGYPYVPTLFLLLCSIIVINAVYSRPFESLIGLFLMLCGVPVYFYFKKMK